MSWINKPKATIEQARIAAMAGAFERLKGTNLKTLQLNMRVLLQVPGYSYSVVKDIDGSRYVIVFEDNGNRVVCQIPQAALLQK